MAIVRSCSGVVRHWLSLLSAHLLHRSQCAPLTCNGRMKRPRLREDFVGKLHRGETQDVFLGLAAGSPCISHTDTLEELGLESEQPPCATRPRRTSQASSSGGRLPKISAVEDSEDDSLDLDLDANGSGPKSLQELYQWPFMILDTLASDKPSPYGTHESGLGDIGFVQACPESLLTSSMLTSLVKNLDQALELHMKYAGIDCPSMVLDMLLSALQARGISTGSKLQHMTASDINRQCRKVLQAFPTAMRSRHIHGDIMDQLPDSVKKSLFTLGLPEIQPTLHATPEALDAWQQNVLQWLDKVKELLCAPGSFPPDLKVPCYGCMDPGLACSASPASLRPDSVKAGFAGNECKDWAAIGRRKGFAGPGAWTLVTAVLEFRARKFAFFFQECTPRFPDWLLQYLLGPAWKVVAVVFGPSQLGKPIRRGRYMSFCYDTSQVAFLGSALHFQRLFCQRSRHLDGDIFYVAPPEFVQAKLDQLVKETMCGLDKGSVPTFMDCHTGTQQCNAKAYLAKQQSLIEKGCSSEEAFIYDLEQSCASRPRFGSTMPCLITHGLMYSAHHQRPLLEEEHLSAMGLPVWPEMQQFCARRPRCRRAP